MPSAKVVPASTSPLSRHGLHVVNAVAPSTAEYVPTGQGVQTVAADPENVPAAHERHSFARVAPELPRNLPAAQGRQFVLSA